MVVIETEGAGALRPCTRVARARRSERASSGTYRQRHASSAYQECVVTATTQEDLQLRRASALHSFVFRHGDRGTRPQRETPWCFLDSIPFALVA